jgi:hypothetical protein|tara:strand:- start:630 stop:944 length:315 start_codon:yes stop_codon:yes gene_type:complete
MTEERMQSDGAIFTNNYKDNEKQPDWTGKVVLDKKLLKSLVEKVKSGQEAEMRVALWNRQSKNGNDYKYCRLDIPQPQKKSEDTFEEEVKPVNKPEISDEDIPF